MATIAKISAALAVTLVCQIRQVSGATIQPRKPASNPFQLYAWGAGIPGFPVMFADGVAVAAAYETANTVDNLLPLYFELGEGSQDDGGFVYKAHPDTSAPVTNAAISSSPFQEAIFSVPSRNVDPSASHDVRIVTDGGAAAVGENSSVDTSHFQMFFRYLTLDVGDGSTGVTYFCAYPSGTPGVWSISWNETVEREGGRPVILRDLKPSDGYQDNPVNLNDEGHEKCQTGL